MKIKSIATSDLSVNELEKRISSLEKQLEEKSQSSLLESMQLGLSFGFNYYFNGQQRYYIQKDSTLGTYGKRHGLSGMLSALMGYKISAKSTVLLNIPLGDISGNPGQAIGVFNKKIAGGLGYGYTVGDLSFIAVLNVFPYERLALEVVKDRKYEQEPYTVANLDNMPTTMAYSPSFTLGICYNILKPGILNY